MEGQSPREGTSRSRSVYVTRNSGRVEEGIVNENQRSARLMVIDNRLREFQESMRTHSQTPRELTVDARLMVISNRLRQVRESAGTLAKPKAIGRRSS